MIAVSHGGKEHGQKHARNKRGTRFKRRTWGAGVSSFGESSGAWLMAMPPGRRSRRRGHGAAGIAGKKRGRRSAIDRDREQGARLERHDNKADPVCGARIVLDPIALGLKDADEFFPDGPPSLVRWAFKAKDLLAGRQAETDDARGGVGGRRHVLRRHCHGRWKRGEGRAGCEQQRDGKRD